MVIREGMQTRFVVLPPSPAVPGTFRNIHSDARRRNELMARMQRLRGKVYASDQAIRESDLTSDGRHKSTIDEHCWHVLSIDDKDNVVACLRYLDESHAGGFDDLLVRHAAVSRCPMYGKKFRSAVEQSMAQTRRSAMRFGEVGGWAVAEEYRGTAEPLRIILATYGLLELLGSCAGVATATFRHGSERMLRKIGLTTVSVGGEELPPYHDPQYGCQMQALYFDSRNPNPRFREWVAELTCALTAAPVVCPATRTSSLSRVWEHFETPLPVPALA